MTSRENSIHKEKERVPYNLASAKEACDIIQEK